MGELEALKSYNPGTFQEVLKKIVETSVVSADVSVDIRTEGPSYTSQKLYR
jgi:hypothetical protein